MKYAVVIPAKNEEETLAHVLQSVADQTIQPLKCLVVDDGSDDKTPEIIAEFNKKYPFIDGYRNENKKKYVVGGHVVQVFNIGKNVLDEQKVDYDYIIKLDADLKFEPTFMEQIDNRLKELGGKWGIVSGTPFYYHNNKKLYEVSPQWHSHGQFKIYSKKCLDEIGGIKLMLGWDCADNIQAIDAGWQTQAFRDINYEMFRKVGGKSSLLRGRIKHGMGAHNLRYPPLYMLIKLTHDLLKPPYIIGSLYYLYGYFKNMFSNNKKQLSKAQVKLLRRLFWSSFTERFRNNQFILQQSGNKK
jgi:biofilm PGA synthesis N-glycosyltransferase PgaC